MRRFTTAIFTAILMVGSTMAWADSATRSVPSSPTITSPTNPHWGWWYNTRVERFVWRSKDTGSGLAGYSFRVDHQTGGKPGKLTQQTSLTLTNLADGRWVLHVWVQDRAGTWSPPAIYKFNLDTTPPRITFISTSTQAFNPYLGTVTWRYSIDQWAHVTLDIRRAGQAGPVLVVDMGRLGPGTHYFTWDGKIGSGQLSPADWHWFHVTATDGVGNSSNLACGGIHVTPVSPSVKRIVVSLTRQTIAAYQNGRLVWSSLATTGNFRLSPTPPGHYHIFARYNPFQFVSPWPPGDPLWYAPAWSGYAMEFISGGYFIHDAPWRKVFGPASQGDGRPGTDYGGTHGCVNVPLATAEFLWKWAPLGTDVDVVTMPAGGEPLVKQARDTDDCLRVLGIDAGIAIRHRTYVHSGITSVRNERDRPQRRPPIGGRLPSQRRAFSAGGDAPSGTRRCRMPLLL